MNLPEIVLTNLFSNYPKFEACCTCSNAVIGDSGLKALAEGITLAPALQTIDLVLAVTDVGDKAAVAIAEVLTKAPKLKSAAINLSQTQAGRILS